jgi:hypothetical protein
MFTDPNVLKKYLSEVFVETGTEHGNGVQIALDCGFCNVISIEINPDLAIKAQERFIHNEKVAVIEGDSSKVLLDVMRELPDFYKSATFWLDAHVNGRKDPVLGSPCPVLKELDMILECHMEKTILIDDMRLFRNPRGLWGNIGIADILSKVSDESKFKVSYEDGYKPADIMVIKCL